MGTRKTSYIFAFRPLRSPYYRMPLIANFSSQIGMWVHDIGAAWLMTSLLSIAPP